MLICRFEKVFTRYVCKLYWVYSIFLISFRDGIHTKVATRNFILMFVGGWVFQLDFLSVAIRHFLKSQTNGFSFMLLSAKIDMNKVQNKFFCFVLSFPHVSRYSSYVFIFIFLDCTIFRKCFYTTLSVAGKKQRHTDQRRT